MSTPVLRGRKLDSEPRIVRLTIEDERNGITALTEYHLIRECMATGKEHTVKRFTFSDIPSGITVTEDLFNYYMDIVDEAPLSGTEYTYHVSKKDEGVDGEIVEEFSNTISIVTRPSNVEGFYISDADSMCDSFTRIPTHLTLSWKPYDITENNLDVIGFNVYYSHANKGTTDWTQWAKVMGGSTSGIAPAISDDDWGITKYDPSQTSCVIEVPQLSYTEAPQDIRLGIVAITKTLQSQLSDVDSISTFNIAHVIVKKGVKTSCIISGSEEDTDLQILNNELFSPHHTITFKDGSFDEDTYVWCERILATEWNEDKKEFHYSIGATNQILKPFDVEFYFPLPTNIDYDVKVDLDGEMVSVPFEYNPGTQRVCFSHGRLGDFKIILIDSENMVGRENPTSVFRDVTRRMIRRLPTWFKMRRNPVESIGAYFLEVIGLQLEDVEIILKYAREQTSILTADLDQLSTLCKAPIPIETSGEDTLAIRGDGTVLEMSPNLEHFIKSPYFLSEEEMVYHNNMFIIDYEENCIYTRRPFEPTKRSQYGEIDIKIYKGVDEPWYDNKVPLEYHQLWNFFDEFGMLLDVKRIDGESNESYKERILDVFKNPSSASRDGLMNGIARELGMRTNLTWDNPDKDFVIVDPMVICNMITVNDVYVPLSDVWFDSSNNIVLKANVSYPPQSEVSYVKGLEMHSLNKKTDYKFQAQLYKPNGLASGILRRYVTIIRNQTPIEWDSFRWGEGYWDAALPENGGVACLPNIADASISGFESYKA